MFLFRFWTRISRSPNISLFCCKYHKYFDAAAAAGRHKMFLWKSNKAKSV